MLFDSSPRFPKEKDRAPGPGSYSVHGTFRSEKSDGPPKTSKSEDRGTWTHAELKSDMVFVHSPITATGPGEYETIYGTLEKKSFNVKASSPKSSPTGYSSSSPRSCSPSSPSSPVSPSSRPSHSAGGIRKRRGIAVPSNRASSPANGSSSSNAQGH